MSLKRIPIYIWGKLRILLSYGIQPKVVFDGQRLEMKFKTHAKRNTDNTRVLTEKIKLAIVKVYSIYTKNHYQQF